MCEVSKYISHPIEVGAYESTAKIPGSINQQAVSILKEMFNQSLNEEVRERRAWAYAIGSSHYNHRYFHEFSINCGALSLKAIDEIEEVIEICIASMADQKELFDQAKYARGSQAIS